MADDRLELIASVKNLTSGPLKDIQRSMRALAARPKKVTGSVFNTARITLSRWLS